MSSSQTENTELISFPDLECLKKWTSTNTQDSTAYDEPKKSPLMGLCSHFGHSDKTNETQAVARKKKKRLFFGIYLHTQNWKHKPKQKKNHPSKKNKTKNKSNIEIALCIF